MRAELEVREDEVTVVMVGGVVSMIGALYSLLSEVEVQPGSEG